MTWTETIAAIFGLICVWLVVRQSVWCWPAGLVQVSLYVVVFFRAKLYSDFVLHIVYVALQFYGWFHWQYGGDDRGELKITRLNSAGFVGWTSASIALSIVWGHAMATFTDAALPYLDAFIAVASLVAQWLMTRKILESWLFWIVVDVVAIGVYLQKSLYVTAGLYFVFLMLATIGYFEWRKSERGSHDENRVDSRQVRTVA